MKRKGMVFGLLTLLCAVLLCATGCSVRQGNMESALTGAGYTVTVLDYEQAVKDENIAPILHADSQREALRTATVLLAEREGERALLLSFSKPTEALGLLRYEESEGDNAGKMNLELYAAARAEGRLDDRYLFLGELRGDAHRAFLDSKPLLQRGLVRISTDGVNIPVGAMLLIFLLSFLLPYAVGNINMPRLVCRRMHGEDLARIVPDAPPTAASAKKIYGNRTALLVVVGEGGLMAAVLFLGMILLGADYNYCAFSQNSMLYIAGAGCLLGQTMPIQKRYRGELGTISLAVMMAILSPITFLLCAVFFALVLLITRFVSLSVITASLLYPLLLNRSLAFFGYGASGVITMIPILLGLMMLYTHRGAIPRIRERTELRISFRRDRDA